MLDNIVIEPMTEDFILWRCLHGGALSKESINEWASAESADKEARQEMNTSILREIARTYGACAILVRDGEQVVGSLRFYPQAVCSPGELCLQGFPAGPQDHIAGKRPLPALDEIENKTLAVHCMMLGSPFQEENPYMRKGLGSRMVRELIVWARERGWEGIEANACEDLSIYYEHFGRAGKTFWEKLGFHVVSTSRTKRRDLPVADIACEQAKEQGLDPDVAQDWRMRFDLT